MFNSLSNKTEFIEAALQSDLNQMDVLCFTEHWLSPNELSIFQIPTFTSQAIIVEKENLIKVRHMEVLVFTLKIILILSLSLLTEFNEYAVENVFEISVVHLPVLKMILLCIYRPPTKRAADYILFLEKLEITLIKVINRSLNPLLYVEILTLIFWSNLARKSSFLT